MTKRRTRWVRILLGSCVAAFLLLLLFPRTGSILLALIRGESFYEGLPTSYWSGVLKEWIHNGGRSQRARGLGRLFYQLDSLVLPDRLHIGHHGLLNLYLPEDDDVATALLIEIQPVLLQLLEDENAEVRRTTADFLGEIRTKIDPSRATPVVHALVAATRDSDIGVRQTAVGALGRLRLDGPVSVPRLIECLKDVQLRWHAAFALAEFGQDANSAVPSLVEVLNDTSF